MGNKAGSLQSSSAKRRHGSGFSESAASFQVSSSSSPTYRRSLEFLSSGEFLADVSEGESPVCQRGKEDQQQKTSSRPDWRRGRRTRTTTLLASDGAEFQVESLPITFRWDCGRETREVSLCGSFSGWQQLRMERSGPEGDFTLMVALMEGCHHYRYLVDGDWRHDPTQPSSKAAGLLTNVIEVRKQDFRVFDALALDDLKLVEGPLQTTSADSDDEYGQQPGRPPRDRGREEEEEEEEQPATIPRYLMELNLNKSHLGGHGSISSQMSELPEPSHVMLKHLYSLSFKDGVMVLGTSLRFRQKKISTIYYKAMNSH